ncbi:hypothetical protein L6452_00661 [Arctium lappa]|uniref:Uncharacterized protein n=1 Tax=Arctium lappa TaxID=4217 RepID=A0ACB9FDY3_ARCLA|nr:hypothetical protein L6452_00661 [Arctium lappa]
MAFLMYYVIHDVCFIILLCTSYPRILFLWRYNVSFCLVRKMVLYFTCLAVPTDQCVRSYVVRRPATIVLTSLEDMETKALTEPLPTNQQDGADSTWHGDLFPSLHNGISGSNFKESTSYSSTLQDKVQIEKLKRKLKEENRNKILMQPHSILRVKNLADLQKVSLSFIQDLKQTGTNPPTDLRSWYCSIAAGCGSRYVNMVVHEIGLYLFRIVYWH